MGHRRRRKPGRDRGRLIDSSGRTVVFEKRVSRRGQHTIDSSKQLITQQRVAWLLTADQYGLRVEYSVEFDQVVLDEAVSSFDDLDNCVDQAEKHHHFDGTLNLDDVDVRYALLFEIASSQLYELRAHDAAGEVACLLEGRVLVNGDRKSTAPEPQATMFEDRNALLENLIAARDAEIDDAFRDEHRYVRGVREDDANAGIATNCKEPSA